MTTDTVKHSTQYDKLPAPGEPETEDIKCLSRWDALRLIADSIEKYGQYKPEANNPGYSRGVAGSCCLIVNPVYKSYATPRRIIIATDAYLDAMVKRLSGQQIFLGEFSDSKTPKELIALLREEADKLERLKL